METTSFVYFCVSRFAFNVLFLARESSMFQLCSFSFNQRQILENSKLSGVDC